MMKFTLSIFAALLLCLTLGSCTTTRYVPVIEHRTDTVQVNHTVRDSIYLSDSIYVNDFVRDDTVWHTVIKWQTKYVSREVRDTTYISKTDSVPVPYEVVKEVSAELTWRQRARLYLADVVIYALVFAAVRFVVKRILKYCTNGKII